MKVVLFYQKKPNFMMKREDAAKLTVADLMSNYVKVLDLDMPDGTLPDKIYSMYQDRPIALAACIRHTSMSCGDIVKIGHTLYVCCMTGWYSLKNEQVFDKCRSCGEKNTCKVTGDAVVGCAKS